MTLRLESSAFREGEPIPRKYTCEGQDTSPALSWSGLPDGSRGLALICEDPDAPGGIWYHWAIFDIPVTENGLSEGFPAKERVGTIRQATNSFRHIGYGGPCPPPGHGPHRYRFRLFAVSVDRLDVPAHPTCAAIGAAARKLALEETVLSGSYQR